MDIEKIKYAIKLLLCEIGEDINREGLKETPDRIAKMYKEIFSNYNNKNDPKISLIKTFSSDSSGIITQKNITFYSMCEHHMLPFFGYVHVGYIPNGQVIGISKISRIVELFSKRLQIQENLCNNIANFLKNIPGCQGTIVLIEAEHTCMTMRGIKKQALKL